MTSFLPGRIFRSRGPQRPAGALASKIVPVRSGASVPSPRTKMLDRAATLTLTPIALVAGFGSARDNCEL